MTYSTRATKNHGSSIVAMIRMIMNQMCMAEIYLKMCPIGDVEFYTNQRVTSELWLI